MSPEHWHAVRRDTLTETLAESIIDFAIDLGGGVTLHLGTRSGAPITLIENSLGDLNAVWYDGRCH